MFKAAYIFILFVLITIKTNAQFFMNAIVKDSITSELLTGATVIEEGTTNGSASDINGKVKLSMTHNGEIKFVISLIGYNKKTVAITIPQRDEFIEIFLSPSSSELEEVTISSVRTNSRIEDIPTRIEVIGLEDMQEENGIKPGNITGILGDIAGVQMQQISASSGNTFARIQGLNGRYTQILKDGMPMYGGLSGNFSILQIPPLDLKQIEIIKGSASTLYGGDAIGGIINLVSKEPAFERELTFTANQTSIGETNFNGYYAKRNSRNGITFFAGQTFQKAFDVDKDGLSETPDNLTTVVHPKFEFYFSKNSTLTINYAGTFGKIRGGNMIYLKDDTKGDLYHVNNYLNRHNADVKWSYDLSENKNFVIKTSGSLLNQDLTTKNYFFSAKQNIFYSEASYISKSEKTDWVIGMNFNGDNFRNKTENISGIESYNYTTLGGFVQNTFRPFKKVTIESGLRGDLHSKYDFFPLGRLSLMYAFNKKFTARINGGLGYKIPVSISYIDQETDLDKIINNPNLEAEYSQGLNADINYSHVLSDKIVLTVNQSFFITDLSHPVYDSTTADQSQIFLKNGSEPLLTKGIQTYLRIQIDETDFYLSYVYTDVRKKYDELLPRPEVTPMHNLSGTFYFPLKNWRLGVEGSYIAGQLNQDYLPVKNYTLVALMISYQWRKATFVLNTENLLDFRQSRHEKIYDGTVENPVYRKLWAPIEGRVVNFSVKLTL
jgi:outer membrane receptor for ferrienterochelin and colicins